VYLYFTSEKLPLLLSKSMLHADIAAAAVLLPAVSWLAFQSALATMLRSRTVQTAGNQKFIPMSQSCSCTARAAGAERTTRRARRQSALRAESQRPSATTAASLFSRPCLSTFFIKKKTVTDTISMWSSRA